MTDNFVDFLVICDTEETADILAHDWYKIAESGALAGYRIYLYDSEGPLFEGVNDWYVDAFVWPDQETAFLSGYIGVRPHIKAEANVIRSKQMEQTFGLVGQVHFYTPSSLNTPRYRWHESTHLASLVLRILQHMNGGKFDPLILNYDKDESNYDLDHEERLARLVEHFCDFLEDFSDVLIKEQLP